MTGRSDGSPLRSRATSGGRATAGGRATPCGRALLGTRAGRATAAVAGAALLASALGLAACRADQPAASSAAREATPPPLPPVDLAAFEPAVREQLAAARRAAEAGAARQPEARAAAWGELGRLYHAYGLHEPASAAYARAVAAAPGEDRWTYLLGVARQEGGALEAAAESLAAAHGTDPGDAAAALRLGQVLVELGRLDDAAAAFRAALGADPRSAAAAHHGLGRAALLAGDLDAAEEHLLRARRLAPDAAPVAHALAELHRRRGEPERAAALTGEAPLAFPDPEVEAVRRLATGAASRVMEGAQALAAGAGGAALDDLRSAVAAAPADPEARLGLAYALVRSGDRSPAAGAEVRRQVEAMLAAAPDAARYRYHAGLLLGALGDWPAAAAELERAVALEPENRDALFRAAGALAYAGDHAAAAERYGRFLAAESDPALRAEAHYLRAESRLRLGAAAAAAADLRDALALQPAHVDARLQLARLLAAAGRAGEAVALVDAGLRLTPGEPRLIAARERLTAIPP